MKTIEMTDTMVVRIGRKNIFVKYEAGQIYERVPEAQAKVILKSMKGRIADE